MLSPQFSLVRVAAPATAPITLAEAKAQMKVESSDDDTIIQRLIDAAVNFVDAQGALGKAMITQTWGQWLSPNPGTVYLLADFNVFGTPNRISVFPKSGKAWPVTQTRDDAIKIEYIIGYGSTSASVPETVRHALIMLVSNWYENRETELIGSISKTLPFGFDDLIGTERNTFYG